MIEKNTEAEFRYSKLSEFITLRYEDDRFFKVAGALSDGHIVPIFPSIETAENFKEYILSSSEQEFDLKTTKINDPFKTMILASQEGAAGFQIPLGHFNDHEKNLVIEIIGKRFIFPFLIRYEEGSSRYPTVLGSSERCAAGNYLTRRGEKKFYNLALHQWKRWDIQDAQYSTQKTNRPLRSHDLYKTFWCISHKHHTVSLIQNDGQRIFDDPTLVLFSQDTALQEYMPPEGYYPIFTTEKSAEIFLTTRQGGAFNLIQCIQEGDERKKVHISLKAQELRDGTLLGAELIEICDLPKHLKAVYEKFSLPEYSKFVINPAGHRDDTAWGKISEAKNDTIKLKSATGMWELDSEHKYSRVNFIGVFDGTDTFHRGQSDFRFTYLNRSTAYCDIEIDGLKLSEMSDAELEETLYDMVVRQAESKNENGVIDLHDYSEIKETLNDIDNFTIKKIHNSWAFNLWEKIGGNYLGPILFRSPLYLARALVFLEKSDRSKRVLGAYDNNSIGFEGSKNWELEDAVGEAFEAAILRICRRICQYGYHPQDCFDMLASANNTMKTFRLTVCGNVGDLISTHLPTDFHTTENLFEEIGVPYQLCDLLQTHVASSVDPESELILSSLVGDSLISTITPDSKLFLSTALLQFKEFGNSPCLDYAPVSVQIVKALEVEVRELTKFLVKDFSEADHPIANRREEETLLHVLYERKEMISLGPLIYALEAMRKADDGILRHARERLEKVGLSHLSHRKLIGSLRNTVLKKYRNGGAHDASIPLETCRECIERLIGSQDNPGIIFKVSSWRRFVQ